MTIQALVSARSSAPSARLLTQKGQPATAPSRLPRAQATDTFVRFASATETPTEAPPDTTTPTTPTTDPPFKPAPEQQPCRRPDPDKGDVETC
ncbi:MAG: hypothetical protein KC475_05300 [Cyanobacteria bacterium HKST-UBA03]|nr:hypothetical protein [Cyanobacteria bacterium HKST-UBA03]